MNEFFAGISNSDSSSILLVVGIDTVIMCTILFDNFYTYHTLIVNLFIFYSSCLINSVHTIHPYLTLSRNSVALTNFLHAKVYEDEVKLNTTRTEALEMWEQALR